MAEILRFPSAEPALTAPTTPSDEAARAAALDTRRSFIVEAPAGSGKTALLVQRFLNLLAGDEVAQPEEVLAMTFTRKATAEMQQRVLEQLQAAHLRTPLGEDATLFDRETRTLALAVLARDAQLDWNLLAQPQRLNIRSLDSICLQIANSLPLLSGSGASGQPIEDARSLYRLAARRTLLQLGGPDHALHHALRTLLLHRDGSLADCESLIADMLADREQWGELVPLGPDALDETTLDRQVRPKLERLLENIVCAGLSCAAYAMPPKLLEELTALAARLGLEPGYKGSVSPLAFCTDKLQPPEATADHLDHWTALISLLIKPSDGGWRASFNKNHLGFEIPKTDAAYLKQLVDSIQSDALQEALCAVLALPPAKYPDDQWAVARALFHVLRRALIELKLLFSERGECDYTELALAARAALSEPVTALSESVPALSDPTNSAENPADTALAAGGHLRHLLVDEMQDTSATQYELIKLLTSSWDGHSQTLFLVGDPKQSIYLFRQARVERFLRTMREQRLGDIRLTALRLTANFRSQAALVQAFNDTFGGSSTSSPIFPPPSDDSLRRTDAVDVSFVAATPSRPPTTPDAIVWHTAVLGEERFDPSLKLTGIPAADHAAQEAIAIRRLIEQRLALSLPEGRNDPLKPKPWTIGVLARARNHLSAIVQELKAHDGRPAVPFRAVDLDPLNELPEVLDALALTRALLHPADRIAWLAVLHAPWCCLGLADLLALTDEGPNADPDATIASLVHARRQHLSPLGQRLLDRVWPILETAAATLGRTPLSVHVERTWRSLGGDAPLAPEQRSNVLRFLRVLHELEAEDGPIDLSALTARIQQLFAEPLANDSIPGGIHVELMTIHKAKGLEWDVVLIPGLHRRPRGNSSPLLNWLELDGAGPTEQDEASILLAPIRGKGEASDRLNDWLKAVRARRERAEEKRLFYVASTRAREQLHLFAALSRKKNETLALPENGSLLKACWPAAEPHFAPLAALPQTLSAELPGAPFIAQLHRAMNGVDDAEPFHLDIAASANGHQALTHAHEPSTLQRLPLSFDPSARFARAAEHRSPYTPASALDSAPAFDRPEGSFGVRAFGNVVHRYLQVLAARLADNSITPDALLAELPSWGPRLSASLRGEGLPPVTVAREASRALRALTLTLSDPVGRWILSPHPSAASEQSFTLASLHNLSDARGLRIDRTFLAGSTPLSRASGVAAESDRGCIWIIDFKTTDSGSRSPDSFAASEIGKYAAQLEAYATLRRSLPGGDRPIHLGLFYPVIPRLLHWPSASNPA